MMKFGLIERRKKNQVSVQMVLREWFGLIERRKKNQVSVQNGAERVVWTDRKNYRWMIMLSILVR